MPICPPMTKCRQIFSQGKYYFFFSHKNQSRNFVQYIYRRKDDKWTRGLHSPSSSSIKSFDLQVANWRIESLGRDSESGSDEEFFDCQGKIV